MKTSTLRHFLIPLLLPVHVPVVFAAAAANDITIQQKNAGNTAFTPRVVPTESAISTTLASFQSALGFGVEDTPAFADVLIGTSGPSVSSSFVARAQAQKLQTSDSAGSPPWIPAIPALDIGLSDFSYFIPVALKNYATRSGLGSKIGSNLGWGFNLLATGYLRLFFGNGSNYTTYFYDSTAPVTTANSNACLIGFTATRAGNVVFSVNGRPLGAAVSIADSVAQTLTSTGAQLVGGGGYETAVGSLYGPMLYDRALSASETVQLYQAGGPDSDDLHQSSVDIKPTIGTYHKWFGTGDVDAGATANAFAVTGAGGFYAINESVFAGIPGAYFKVNITVTGTVSGGVCVAYTSGLQGTYVPLAVGTHDYFCQAPAGVSNGIMFGPVVGTGGITINSVTIAGCLATYSTSYPGVGYQLHDVSGHLADITVTASGVTHVFPSAFGPQQVRATLTWAGSHEAKSLLGQVALPANAVVTSVITTASAGSAGAGMTVGSVTTPNLFVTAAAYTTVKKVQTLAAQLPAGTATNDLSLVVDPDDQNYTGTIQIAVNYVLAQ